MKKIKSNFKSKLNEITTGNPKHKSKNQLDTVKNVKNLYESRQKVIDLFDDYVRIKFKAMYQIKHGTRLKILTPKEMLQRLPIALAQVKAGNNSESSLNQISQIVYSLYQSKEITKKYTIT